MPSGEAQEYDVPPLAAWTGNASNPKRQERYGMRHTDRKASPLKEVFPLHTIVLGVLSVFLPMSANAYSIATETVDGITWTYEWSLQWTYSRVGAGGYYPAVPQNTTGFITIPRKFRSNKTAIAISSYAFDGRSGITGISIPSSISEIESYAFRGCEGLTSITIPYSVASIGTGVFVGCSNLKSIAVEPLNQCFKSESNMLLSSDGTILLAVPEGLSEFAIPTSVKTISGAFMGNKNLTKIEVPHGITTIEKNAFNGCENLGSIVLPESISSISGFGNCNSLSNITFHCDCPVGVESSKILANADSVRYYRRFATSFQDIVPKSIFAGYLYEGLGEWVNCYNRAFTTDGNSQWYGDSSVSHDGYESLRSGTISNNGVSWVETTINCEGRISFWWKSSCEEYDGDVYDYAYLSVDGVPQGALNNYQPAGIAIGGQTDWTNIVFDVTGEGAHTIRWTYCKDDLDDGNVGEDCVWLDEFSFTPKPTISFDIGASANGNAPDSIHAFAETHITLPNQDGFGWSDHVFNGWCEGIENYAGGADYIVPSSNVTLTAKWIAKSFVSFDIGNGDGTTPEMIKALPDESISLPTGEALLWADHVFNGWTDGINKYAAGANYSVPSSNVTLTAIWIAKSFVSFDIGGGNGTTPEMIKALPDETITLPTDSGFGWTDHVFDGWSDGTNDYAGDADYTVPSSNVTLTAKWIAKSFVSFDIGNGTGTAPETIKDVPNAVVTLPMADGIEWIDHVFNGWSDGESVYPAGADYTVPTSNITLTAQWIAKSFVSFDIGNGTGETPQTIKALPDEIISLPTGEGLTLTDYAFGGWTDGAVDFSAGGNYTVPSSNVVLSARWIAMRFLTFALDGGEGEIPITIKDVPNATVTLPNGDGLHKAKHTFIGWNDGTQTYEAGAEYVVTDTSIEFTAVWTANTLDAPVITSADVANGGMIETESATIEIATEDGTAIYYTIDGTEPTTNSALYAAPITADGMYVTIKAFAVKDDCFDSAVAEFSFTRKPYSVAECLNAGGKTVSTGGVDAKWERVLGGSAHDGVAALRSGAIGEGETSTVEMTVEGTGQIAFWWKVSSERETVRPQRYDYVSFLIDGTEQKWLGGEKDWTNEVFAVSGEGAHTLKWVYQKNENGLTQGDDCAWLDEVKWTPWREITTKQTAVPIPYGWLEAHGLLNDTDAETAAKRQTGKRDGSGRFLTVEDDYIAGTDPTNENDLFTVSISISNGVPVVTWKPDLNTNGANRVYTIYGKEALNDLEWITPTNALCRFFKVGVAMPTANENHDSTGGGNGGEGGSGNSGSGDTGSIIPSGYLTNDVQCVSCTGSEWYDLGLPPTLTMKTQIKCSFAGENEHMGIIGVLPASDNDINDYRLFIASSPYEWFLDFPDSSRIHGSSAAIGEVREVEFGNFYIKDLETDTMLISGSTVTASCPTDNIRLFRTNYAYLGRYTTGSVYYVKIYDLNTSNEYELVRNLVPCKSDANEVGLFDLVGRKFYKSNGTNVAFED